MNKEDYFKYYIQGSNHYLIPKDIFNELFDEMVNWREEVKELKKQLEKSNTTLDTHNELIEYMKKQQKKFIEWLENRINQVINTEFLDERIQIAGLVAYNRVLSKYKSIIGGKDAIK